MTAMLYRVPLKMTTILYRVPLKNDHYFISYPLRMTTILYRLPPGVVHSQKS